jgi:ABC-type Na+ efflux pump permease subunit
MLDISAFALRLQLLSMVQVKFSTLAKSRTALVVVFWCSALLFATRYLLLSHQDLLSQDNKPDIANPGRSSFFFFLKKN